ncbi:tyrosine-protein kinase receptor UFO-like isoform X1 [Paramormyrops kingsleyae]|uniref:tyrosine-protein kinase receptor UFO-like isoform X1 n=1 Tax=Paramormyrops kingsleyae TaxID=1676925 RepID=UPI003B97071E
MRISVGAGKGEEESATRKQLSTRPKAREGNMGHMNGSLLLVAFLLMCPVAANTLLGPWFVRDPANVTLSLGKAVQLQCRLEMVGGDRELPDVVWQKDGVALDTTDTNQVEIPITEEKWQIISKLSIESAQVLDMGDYRCVVTTEGRQVISLQGHIQLEGLPHFSTEPQDMTVMANVSFSLHCVAHGPPEPVRVIWLQDGVPVNSLMDPMSLSPSTLTLSGLNKTSTFSCEAHNYKGVATSGSGLVTVIPSQPRKVHTTQVTNTSLHVSWQPSFGGVHPITECSVQHSHTPRFFHPRPGRRERGADSAARTAGTGRNVVPFEPDPNTLSSSTGHQQNVSATLSSHVISDLEPLTAYRVRVACRSSQGQSPWTDWVTLSTAEGVPDSAPENITAILNGTDVVVSWAEPTGKLNGRLMGYQLEYRTPETNQIVLDVGLYHELPINLSSPLSNVSFRVCAYTVAGPGPWSDLRTLTLTQPAMGESRGLSSSSTPSWQWWYVVMAIGITVVLAVLAAVYVTRLRRKETRFGEAFEPMMERGQLVVRYQARRTYSRRSNEATLNRLGISEELKQKLQDVMVDRHKLTLGKTLGEGEFGSVMEGLLTQEESVLRVAVKTMKIAICTRTEMEDFLREAACMKEFDHPNIMRLLGVCLQTVEGEGYPSPVVILPYMKHGDLHSYLLYSRLGDCPVFLPSQMLVKFMTDIARGMEYLSSRNFIHRDLAARNCMLNENMTVCVADFGLSKKIYNGDYYRQGRISKMPVKWIAIESLADRVYTTKSDVWSFGVTMWEIATRGQTPYPGVENSEIYDYLRQGNRLKQPPDCLDSIYALMFSCWLLSPKERPGFEFLRCELEKTLEGLPDLQDPEEILYVNMEEAASELGAVGGREPPPVPLPVFTKASDPLMAPSEVQQPGRYVLCPQLETQRFLSDSVENLSLATSSSAPALLLPPAAPRVPTPTAEELGECDRAGRKVPWQ